MKAKRSIRWRSDELIDENEFTLPNDASSVATCRRVTGEFVEQLGGDAELVDTLRIAVSELASNVVRHAPVDAFDVTVRATSAAIYLDVSGASGTPQLDQLSTPPPSQESGRGLLIVRALADETVLLADGDDAVIRCRFLRPIAA